MLLSIAGFLLIMSSLFVLYRFKTFKYDVSDEFHNFIIIFLTTTLCGLNVFAGILFTVAHYAALGAR